jgi:hypothetical protein
MDKITPCPACSETPRAAKGSQVSDGWQYQIVCSCGVCGPLARTPGDAIAAWNNLFQPEHVIHVAKDTPIPMPGASLRSPVLEPEPGVQVKMSGLVINGRFHPWNKARELWRELGSALYPDAGDRAEVLAEIRKLTLDSKAEANADAVLARVLELAQSAIRPPR